MGSWRIRRFDFSKRPDQGRAATDPALAGYQFAPTPYITERLGWTPWSGDDETPGQQQIIDAYTLALRQQHERRDFQGELIAEGDLQYWEPGQPIKNRLRVEAGHTVGKTKLSSGLVNHFFDCFAPSIVYTFAPSWRQIHDLLWKEIKTDRDGKGLPGRILDLKLEIGHNHFATGMATNDNGGNGTERVQGQHGPYLMFVLDEAEGIPKFVWDAIDSMASGGIYIVLMLANPRTRSSRFYKARTLSTVKSFRMSCVGHPNVIAGREIVPGAVLREYVEVMLEKHCAVVTAHDDDEHTFALPFPVQVGEVAHAPGTIFLPNAEFLFRVLGIPPANRSDKTLLPAGRYEAACKRAAPPEDRTRSRIGVDVAGFGTDYGTIYVRHAGRIWRAAQITREDQVDYFHAVQKQALALAKLGVTDLQIRVDAGGGFGGGVIALLRRNVELRRAFRTFAVIEVHFGGSPHDKTAYADLATEMYAQAAESVKALRIESPPEELEGDLCERKYDWVNREGVELKKLEPKSVFRKPERQGRSPDDGDGFVMCAAPDFIFVKPPEREHPPVNPVAALTTWSRRPH